MRTLKILSLALLVALLLLITGRCSLLALATRQLLRLQGATGIAVRVSQLSLHRVSFDAIAFSLPLAGDRITVHMEDLIASYDIASLRAGRMDRLSIGSMSINLPKPAIAGHTSSRTAMSFSLPDPSWQERIPIRRLTIRRLCLTGGRTGPLAKKELSLDLRTDNKGTHCKLAATEVAPLRLITNISRDNRMTLFLNDGRKPGAVIFRLFLDASDRNRLTGKFTLQLNRLARIAAFVGGKVPRLSGAVNGKIQLETGGAPPSFFLNLDSGATEIASLALQHLSLRLKGAVPGGGQSVILDRTSHLALTGLQIPGLAAATVDMNLAGTYKREGAELLLQPTPDQPWTGTGFSIPAWRCERLEIRPALTLRLQADRATVDLAEDFRLVAGNVRHRTLHLKDLALAPQQQTRIMFRPGQWKMQPGDWLLTPSVVTARESGLRLQPVTLAVQSLICESDQWRGQGVFRTPELTLTNHGHHFSLSDLVVDLQADNHRIQGRAAFSLGKSAGRLETIFRHDPATARGGAELHTATPIRFSPEQPLISPLPRLPVDLDRGILTLSGKAFWAHATTPVLRLGVTLDDGAGRAGDIRFSGLHLKERMQILPRFESISPATITLARLHAGIKVENLHAVITLTTPPGNRGPQLRIDRFTAHLFGGRIATSRFVLDPSAPDSTCIITINGFNLARINRLMQVKDLRVSGLVDGRLPVHLTKNGIRIQHGELHNRPPGGVIRYRPAQGNSLAGMEITGYALKAMENFRYNLLTASVEYHPDGQLNVALHLEGHSPKLATTRPVHLNINTEQNLLSLLKSLRYSSALTDELDKSIQHHYNQLPATSP